MKTAGTSIEVYLSQVCDDNDIVTPITPYVAPHVSRNYRGFWNPVPELVSKRFKGARRDFRDFMSLRKFYNHIPASSVKFRVPARVWNGYFKFCVERNPWDKTLSDYYMVRDRRGGNLTLDQYLMDGKYCLNYPKYTDSGGMLIVDKVLKFENLIDELTKVFDKLGVPFDGNLGVKAKSEHRTCKRPYQEVLTTEQKLIIESAFSREIAMHGYHYQS